MPPLRHVARLVHRIDILGRDAEMGNTLFLRQRKQRLRPRMKRRAIEQHQPRARQQAGDQPVPHHPAAGGEVEQHVVLAQVAVQQMLADVLQQDAAGPVHDALRLAGGAGGEQDEQRMVKRQRREGKRRARMRCDEIRPRDAAPQPPCHRRRIGPAAGEGKHHAALR